MALSAEFKAYACSMDQAFESFTVGRCNGCLESAGQFVMQKVSLAAARAFNLQLLTITIFAQ